VDKKELEFAEALEKARRSAKEQGNLITAKQVNEIFSCFALSEGQYELIYDYLKKHKIGLDEAVNLDDYLTAEEKDFLKDYLKLLAEQHKPPYYLNEVVQIAKLYAGQGVLLEDLIGEGNVVLAANTDAAEADLHRLIKEAMEVLISETADNRNVDKQMVERVNAIADAAKELAEAFGRKVTVLELADEGKYSVDEIVEAISMAGDDILEIIS